MVNLPIYYNDDGLVSKPPTLFTAVSLPSHGTSCALQLKSIFMTAKFGSFFEHVEMGEIRQIRRCNLFFLPKSDFSDFCYPIFFFYQTLTNPVWVLLIEHFAEIVDYSLFKC